MKKRQLFRVVLGSVALVCLSLAQQSKSDSHVMVRPNELKWGPAPPKLPPGSQMAVLAGDPSQAGSLFTIRAKLPDGYTVPPHWHPTDEHVTVISGVFRVGMGEKLDKAAYQDLSSGSYVMLPKEMRHYAAAKGATVIQVHGVGPFTINYVNPGDDPTAKTGGK